VSPYDRGLAYLYGGKASANFGLKRYDQAIEQFRQAIAINPNYIPWAHTIPVAALALTEALQGYLALPSTGPLKTIAAWKALNKFSQQGVRRYLEVTERMYAGLRKAGMPEH
jgi:tetratricopeptide (TPR) repeat protein